MLSPPSGAVFLKKLPGVLISHDVTLINNESSIFFLSFFCFVFCLILVDKAEVVKYPEFFHGLSRDYERMNVIATHST